MPAGIRNNPGRERKAREGGARHIIAAEWPPRGELGRNLICRELEAAGFQPTWHLPGELLITFHLSVSAPSSSLHWNVYGDTKGALCIVCSKHRTLWGIMIDNMRMDDRTNANESGSTTQKQAARKLFHLVIELTTHLWHLMCIWAMLISIWVFILVAEGRGGRKDKCVFLRSKEKGSLTLT